MNATELQLAVDQLEADARLPRRAGGLGPLQRQYATRDRLERAVQAVERTCRETPFAGDTDITRIAVQRAKDAEPKSGLISMFLMWLIPIVIEWAVKRWLLKRQAG